MFHHISSVHQTNFFKSFLFSQAELPEELKKELITDGLEISEEELSKPITPDGGI